MEDESSTGFPLVLHAEADPSRLGGTAICGFSTVGSVGVIATSHLISALKLDVMGTVLHPQFPAIALIHDSVLCRATDMCTLSTLVRKTYMSLFAEHEPLTDFALAIGAEEQPPIIGDLKPEAVIDSQYFFC